MDKIRVWFAGNSIGITSEFDHLLANCATFEWIGKSDQSLPAIARISQAHPDVLVLDVATGDRRLSIILQHLLEKTPALHIVALGAANDKRVILRLLRHGVQGYISRDEIATELTRAIQAVAQGNVFLCPSASIALLNEYRKHASTRKPTHPCLPGSRVPGN